jgi:hypothetical protein
MGCGVLDLHQVGGGLPDIIVACLGILHAVEIKNPENSYGRKGLNKLQRAFNEKFGGCVEIVRTEDQAVDLVNLWRSHPTRRIWPMKDSAACQ